jgi:hypothetical protein
LHLKFDLNVSYNQSGCVMGAYSEYLMTLSSGELLTKLT